MRGTMRLRICLERRSPRENHAHRKVSYLVAFILFLNIPHDRDESFISAFVHFLWLLFVYSSCNCIPSPHYCNALSVSGHPSHHPCIMYIINSIYRKHYNAAVFFFLGEGRFSQISLSSFDSEMIWGSLPLGLVVLVSQWVLVSLESPVCSVSHSVYEYCTSSLTLGEFNK